MTGQGSFWFGSSDFYPETIDQSLRFESGYLGRTPSSASNQKTWTFSCWFKIGNTSANHTLWSAGATGTPRVALYLSSGGQLITDVAQIGTYDQSVARFRDTTNWYHLVWAFDTTQATGSNRSRMYINGTEITLTKTRTFSQDTNYAFNGTVLHTTGGLSNSTTTFVSNLYLAEVNFVEGTQLTPTSFGETKNGVWIPKDYSGSYGTNGFRMTFGNSSAIGEDSAGSNDFGTVNNINDYDVVPDSPTNNFPTFNPLYKTGTSIIAWINNSVTLSEGNLRANLNTGNETQSGAFATFTVPTSGKWYWEMLCIAEASGSIAATGVIEALTGTYIRNASNTTGRTFGAGDIINIAFDADNNKIFFGINGTFPADQTPTDSSDGTAATGSDYLPYVWGNHAGSANQFAANFGQDSSFAGEKSSGSDEASDANGIGDFYDTPPSGYLALCSSNLPDTTISPNKDEQADDYFLAKTYTGNGTTGQTIDFGFDVDFIWSKLRSTTQSHFLANSSSGDDKYLYSDDPSGEVSYANSVEFVDNGVKFDDAPFNTNTHSYVGWGWHCNSGTTSSNTDGSITSTVQVNTKAGFSIVIYTGTGNNETFGHGLDFAPEMILLKKTSTTGNWTVGEFNNSPNTKYLKLNTNDDLITSSTIWNNTSPTSTVVSIGTSSGVNTLNVSYIAFCLHSVEGYSKIGSYTGNSLADGTFVYTGFRPAYIMVKKTTGNDDWIIHDNARSPFNVVNGLLEANTPDDEFSDDSCDFVSNGFKWRLNSGARNTSGQTYIYMAFAEQPFKFSNAR